MAVVEYFAPDIAPILRAAIEAAEARELDEAEARREAYAPVAAANVRSRTARLAWEAMRDGKLGMAEARERRAAWEAYKLARAEAAEALASYRARYG